MSGFLAMSGSFLTMALDLALAMLVLAMLLTVWRLLRGPTLADRVLALDMLGSVAIGFMAVFALRTGFFLYVDIAIALGLVGFLATVAFARFLLSRPEKKPPPPPLSPPRPARAGQRRTRR
nr:cation:proton antiporter [uncultured Gellertiella sp.]